MKRTLLKVSALHIIFIVLLFSFQWKWQHPKPQGNSLNKIYFIDDQTGYVSSDGAILKSTDGGNSWNILNTKSRFRIYDIQFTNKDSGWICGYKSGVGGIIEFTYNGGLNWETLFIDSGFNDLRTLEISKNSIWVFGQSPYYFYSSDYGRNWIKINNLPDRICGMLYMALFF